MSRAQESRASEGPPVLSKGKERKNNSLVVCADTLPGPRTRGAKEKANSIIACAGRSGRASV